MWTDSLTSIQQKGGIPPTPQTIATPNDNIGSPTAHTADLKHKLEDYLFDLVCCSEVVEHASN